MKYCLILLVALQLLQSCKNGATEATERVIDNDTVAYFQLKEFFEAELKDINATPYFIYKITATGSKEDSVAITTAELNQLAQRFSQPDINDKSIKKYYQESVFHDQTIKTYTISYTATKNTLPLQTADIIFKDDAKTVNRIFLRKFYEEKGKVIKEQLTWKPNQSFQIIRSEQTTENAVEQTVQVLVVWNDTNE
jgi:hypothetical protein